MRTSSSATTTVRGVGVSVTPKASASSGRRPAHSSRDRPRAPSGPPASRRTPRSARPPPARPRPARAAAGSTRPRPPARSPTPVRCSPSPSRRSSRDETVVIDSTFAKSLAELASRIRFDRCRRPGTPTAERMLSNSIQCGFESHPGHRSDHGQVASQTRPLRGVVGEQQDVVAPARDGEGPLAADLRRQGHGHLVPRARRRSRPRAGRTRRRPRPRGAGGRRHRRPAGRPGTRPRGCRRPSAPPRTPRRAPTRRRRRASTRRTPGRGDPRPPARRRPGSPARGR